MEDTIRHFGSDQLAHLGRVAVYGAGGLGAYVLKLLNLVPGAEVVCFIDSNRSGEFMGLPLLCLNDFKRNPPEVDLILIASSAWRDIVLNLKEVASKDYAIFDVSEQEMKDLRPPSRLEWVLEGVFRLFLAGRHRRIWKKATVNHRELGDKAIPCRYCGSTEGEFIFSWPINNIEHFGLFENDIDRMKKLHFIGIANYLPKSIFHKLLSVSLSDLKDVSNVHCCRCPVCGLDYQNFPHSQASKEYYYSNIYRIFYENVESDGSKTFGRAEQEYFVKTKEVVVRYLLNKTGIPIGSRILEVGCAEGIAVSLLTEQGYDAYGIEPSSQMVAYARKKLGLSNVSNGTYSSRLFDEDSFDCIFTQHVAEHVVDLRGFFAALATHVRPGGHVLIQVPCADDLGSEGYEAALGGGHMNSMSEGFLVKALNDHGLEPVEIIRTSKHYLKNNPTEFYKELNVFSCGDRLNGISVLARKNGLRPG